ncbi:MAG TPA: hypothetical protein DER23_07470 [Clostridiales bacterium]|jgi:hypothetical protein|nr:hypothetical protein [Clostridiales bacterium]
MFRKLKTTVQQYAAKYDVIAGVLSEQKQKIFTNVDWSSSKKDKEFAAAKEGFDLAHIELVKEYQAKVKADIDSIRVDFKKTITNEVGANEIAELKLLMDWKLSEFELQAYGEKYQGNYKALRLLKKIAENNGFQFVFTSDEDILYDLGTLQSYCLSAISQYEGKTAGHNNVRLIIHGAGIDMYEQNYNNFLNPFIAL